MINANIKKLFADALSIEKKGERKWLELGNEVRAEYVSAEAFTAVKVEFLDEVVFPAMGDDAVRVMRAEIPRKGTKAWNEATESQRSEWKELKDRRATVNGAASSYFARVRDKYAFPSDEGNGTPEPRNLKTRTNEELAALVKAHERSEDGNAEVIKYLNLALQANNK